MRSGVNGRALLLALTCALGLSGAVAQTASQAPLELALERELGAESLDKIADGTAAQGHSRIEPPTVVEAEPSGFSLLPALALGGLLVGLAGFGVGVLIARRKTVPQPEAPVQLWADADELASELDDVRTQLRNQQQLTDELHRERESLLEMHQEQLDAIRNERNAATGEVHALRLRQDDSTLGEAQNTIDELRAEVERLRGAEDDLDREVLSDDERELLSHEPASDTVRAHLEERQIHISELEELLIEVRSERDELEGRVVGRDAQLRALEQTLEHRDEELDAVETQVKDFRNKFSRIDTKRVSELEIELASLHEQIQTVLAESDHSKARVKEFEQALAQKTAEIEQLESNRDQGAEQIAARDHDVTQSAEQMDTLQRTLAQAEERIMRLEAELATANDELELINRDPTSEELQNENVRMSALLIQRDQTVSALKEQLDEIQDQTRKIEIWSSTVTSLEDELRRKSTVIDNQADNLRVDHEQVSELQEQLADLQQQVTSGEEEANSLRSLLADARAVVLSLREELDGKAHDEPRVLLAQNPEQDPYGQHANTIDPYKADIEALRFTVRSRRDLAQSLESILAEERGALESADKRAAAHDQMLVSLKNEIAANRITIASMHNRLTQLKADGVTARVAGPETEHLEHELLQSVRMIEALRIDLHKWRRRIKPLHEGMLTRDNRIAHLEAEVEAFRNASGARRLGIDATGEAAEDVSRLLASTLDGLAPDEERQACLTEMEQQWRRIVELEAELADTGQHLARAMELDESHNVEIEHVNAAREVQIARINEMRGELIELGVEPEQPPVGADNVVDLLSRRPS